jgi:hypothetical protein
LWDPFNQNVLNGDYPIYGQHTFIVLTAMSTTLVQPRRVPVQATGFESTSRAGEAEFFGRPGQAVFSQYFTLGLELFHGDAAFKPVDWRVKLTPVFNINYVEFAELGVVNPDVRHGSDRGRSYHALEEWFAEAKLADLSSQFDFMSVRAGSKPLTSDVRSFIFSDTNRGVRLFGNFDGNRAQFNLASIRSLTIQTLSAANSATGSVRPSRSWASLSPPAKA